MFDFFHNLDFQAAVDFLNANPHIIGIFSFSIVFLESMAMIGVIVPGVIVMPAIGFLIGSSIAPAGSTFLYVISGAVIGDCLSYLIGAHFKNRIHGIWPFTRWPGLLAHGEKFFHSHGGKSVFIGRFAGPTRAVVPMVAGMLRMPFLRFFLISIPSASFWAASYLIPGAILGALSLELPPKIAAKFAIGGLLSFIGLWLVFWLIHHYFRQIWHMMDYYIMQAWKYLQKHKGSSWMAKALSDPKEPDNHQQLTLLIITVLVLVLFLVVMHQVFTFGGLSNLSKDVYYLLRSLHTYHLQVVFMLITFFGDIKMLLIASGMIILWLVRNRNWYVAINWAALMFLSMVVVTVFKFFMYYPRPGGVLYELNASSFPSAHVVFSLSFLGFLAVIISRELKSYRKKIIVYSIVGALVSLIAISRIYLGAHWLADIIAGALLGLAMVFVATIFYRRRHVKKFEVRKFTVVVLSIFIAVWSGYSILEFKKEIKEYDLVWPERVVTLNNLTSKNLKTGLPLCRLNRLGKPIDAFNVVYVGKLEKISNVLSKLGWESQAVTFDFQSLLKNFSKTSIVNHLTLFPQLYQNKKVSLLFTKTTKDAEVVLVLRLWPSSIDLKDSNLPLWIGEVEYNHTKPIIFSLEHFRLKPKFIGATDFLAKQLSKDFRLWKKHYSLKDQYSEMRNLDWDGRLLIVKSR